MTSTRLGRLSHASRSIVRSVQPRAVPPALVIGLWLGGFVFLPGYLLYAGSSAVVSGLIGLGLFLPIAALREMPLNAAGIAGLSAYLFAHLATDGGLQGHMAGILLALSAAITVSVLTGLAALVVTGLYFVVASLVVQLGIEKVVFSIPGVTNGGPGWSVSQPVLHGWFDTQRAIYVIVGGIVLSIVVGVRLLLRSRLGFQTVLVGHVPEGASAMGLRSWLIKLFVFAASGLLIGIGGLLLDFVNGAPPPTFAAFGLIFSVIYVAIPIASGMRDLSSIWLVAAAFTAIPILLERFHLFPNFMSGMILLLALLLGQYREWSAVQLGALAARFRRVGRVAEASDIRVPGASSIDHELAPQSVAKVVGASASETGGGPPPSDIEARRITVDFGGVRAVDDVSLRLLPGHRIGIVGANGAGKTTLINALTGFVEPQHGSVLLGGRDITRSGPMARARAGIHRTFQFPRLADALTAEQNVVSVHGYCAGNRDRVDWLLSTFGLDGKRAAPVAELSFGQRRKLELVRALAVRPHVLLLDEPTGGLMDDQAEALVDVLVGLQAMEGWALLVVEHNPRVLTRLSQHLLVLENGRTVVEGPTDDVIWQEEVRRVYLGRRVDATRTPHPYASYATPEPRITVTPSIKGKAPRAGRGLIVRDMYLSYGPMPVLRGVSLDCPPGQVVGVVGGNGVGKTSLLSAIAGLVSASAGALSLDGHDITRWPDYRRGQAGIVMVAERRRVLPSLSVRDNLRAGGWGVERDEVEDRVDRVLRVFPRIADREAVPAYRLSGGEQRMLSIGRALVAGARCLLLDEFSLSLSPRMVGELTGIIRALADEGRSILLVEQYIGALLEIADTTHVLQRGRFVFDGPSGVAADWLEEHGYLSQTTRSDLLGRTSSRDRESMAPAPGREP